MADNVVANAGTGGATFAADDIAGVHYPRTKISHGADGSATDVSTASPLPAQLRNSSGTEIATAAAPLRTDPTGSTAQPVTDNGGTITMDTGQLPAALGQTTAAGSLSVVLASNQGVVPINDNGGSITVDASSLPLPTGAATETTLAALNTKTATAKTSDYDTGAGTDTVEMVGIALPGAGGAVQGGTSTNPIRVDPTGTTTQPVSAASLPLPTGAATESTLSAVSGKLPATLGQKAMTASMAVVLASDQASVPVAATLTAETTKVIGTVNVAAGQTIATTNAGTFAVQAGQVAHDAAVSGNPVLAAARANLNEPTAVADGDATHLWADLLGRLVVIPGHPNPESPVTVNATASGNTTVIAAPGASTSLYICKGSIHNSDSANVTVQLQEGAGGTARWIAELAAEGGGSVFDFGARGWKVAANTLLNVNLSGAGNVRVNISEYYIAPG